MGREVITTELIDPEEASEVLNDPEVYDRIADDNTPPRIEWPSDAIYAGGYVDGNLASVSGAHLTERGYQYHFQALKQYRPYKYELGRQGLELIMPMIGKAWCEIPDLYPEVYHFAKRFGFRDVEVLKDHYLKNGVRYDSRILEL